MYEKYSECNDLLDQLTLTADLQAFESPTNGQNPEEAEVILQRYGDMLEMLVSGIGSIAKILSPQDITGQYL